MPSLHRQHFMCFWQPSIRLSWSVIGVLVLASVAAVLAAIAVSVKCMLLLLLALQIYAQWRRIDQAQQPQLRMGLKHTAQGWQMWSSQAGWRPVQLRADSMAIPALVLLRYRHPDQWFYRSALVPFDSLTQDSHRRLRVQLKFSRRRWQAVK